jgi:cyclohexanecarboxylate-CoA ligase
MVRGQASVADPRIVDGEPAVVYPPTLWALLKQTAGSHPTETVLADDHGRSFSRTELIVHAEAVAAALAAQGVGTGSVVSWQLPTVVESIVLLLALARLDAVQNPLIPILRENEVSFITDQVGTDVLVVPSMWRGFDHGAMAREIGKTVGFSVIELDLETPPGPDDLRLPTGQPGTLPPEPLTTPGDDAVRWLYFSSGTTGKPKGARHTDSSIMASGSGMVGGTGFGAGDVYPIAWPISHIGGGTMLTASLVAGTQLVLFDSFDKESSPLRMASHGPTYLGTALPFFRAFMDAQLKHGDEPLFPRAHRATFGGAPLPEAVHDELREVLGIDTVLGSYGLTEFPIAATTHVDDSPEIRQRSVGRPSPGAQVRVGAADGSGVSPDGEGELYLRGPQRLVGYVDEALDLEAFDEEGWFRTGDLGTVDEEGNIRITGRLKDVIIRNAENISALEVEDVLRSHPAVSDVTVIGLPDPRTGERVCAVVVVEPGTSFDMEAMVEVCTAAGLARYKHPEQLEVVEGLERDAMGKVRKEGLKARFGPQS